MMQLVQGLKWKQGALPFGVGALVLACDLATKSLVRANMDLGDSLPADGRFRLTYSTNSGGVFGLPIDSAVLTVMAFVVVIVIGWACVSHFGSLRRIARVGLGLIMGGALGNLVDRVRFGEVTDFIDVRLWGDFHWATFNVADSALTTGIFVMVYSFWTLAMGKESVRSDATDD